MVPAVLTPIGESGFGRGDQKSEFLVQNRFVLRLEDMLEKSLLEMSDAEVLARLEELRQKRESAVFEKNLEKAREVEKKNAGKQKTARVKKSIDDATMMLLGEDDPTNLLLGDS
jgi:hypothetical protein